LERLLLDFVRVLRRALERARLADCGEELALGGEVRVDEARGVGGRARLAERAARLLRDGAALRGWRTRDARLCDGVTPAWRPWGRLRDERRTRLGYDGRRTLRLSRTLRDGCSRRWVLVVRDAPRLAAPRVARDVAPRAAGRPCVTPRRDAWGVNGLRNDIAR